MNNKKYQSIEFFTALVVNKSSDPEMEMLKVSEIPKWKKTVLKEISIDEYVRYQQAQIWKALDEGYYDCRFYKLSDAVNHYNEAKNLNDIQRLHYALIDLGAEISQLDESYEDALQTQIEEDKVNINRLKNKLAALEKKLPLVKKQASLKLCKHAAQKIATDLWGTSEHCNKRVGDMTQEVKSEFYTKYPNEESFNDNTFRRWIKEIAPAHAKQRGRPAKK